jgi:DNA-binding transcriptional LysR family regulator
LPEALYAPTGYDLDGPVRIIDWDEDTDLPPWAQRHFSEAQIAMRVDHLAGKYAALKAGIGITSLPSYLPNLLEDKTVTKLPLDPDGPSWTLWLLYHADLQKNARMIKCRAMLFEALRSHTALSEAHVAPPSQQRPRHPPVQARRS